MSTKPSPLAPPPQTFKTITHVLAAITGVVVLALTQPSVQAALSPYPKALTISSFIVAGATAIGWYHSPKS